MTLVGFSMGGGEVARYIARHGQDRLRSVVFAAAVPPYLLQSDDNPDGPLTEEAAAEMTQGLEADRTTFFDGFTQAFFSAGGELKVTEEQRQEALVLCHQSDQKAALGCMEAFGTTDFRDDLAKVTVPTLVIHGDGDAHRAVRGVGQAHPRGDRGLRAGRRRGRSARLQRQPRRRVQPALLEFLALSQR